MTTHSLMRRAEAVRRYQAGESGRQIAKEMGVSSAFVYWCLNKSGITARARNFYGRKFSLEKRNNAIADYVSGMSAEAVGEKHGIHSTTIWDMVSRRNLSRSLSEAMRKYNLNEAAFDTITPDGAYWIGFLMADGCVADVSSGVPRISVRLKATDAEHLEKFKAFVGSTHPVKCREFKAYKNSYNSADSASITFPSERIASKLAEYGVVPRKTETAKVIGLEDNPDFWRGVIDGDGSMYFSISRGEHQIPRLGLSGSGSLVRQFSRFVTRKFPKCHPPIHPDHLVSRTRLTGHFAVEVVRILYHGATTALSRKADIAKRILSMSAADPKWCNRNTKKYI